MLRLLQIISVLLMLILNFSQINCFSKFGRGCNDIGCPPDQACVITQEVCQIGQLKGKECGSYPTCKRTGSPKQTESRIQPTGFSNLRNSPSNSFGNANSAWYNNPIIKHHNPPPTVVSASKPTETSGKNTKKPNFLRRLFG